MKIFLKQFLFSAFCVAASFQAQAAPAWASCAIQLKASSESVSEVWLVLEPFEVSGGQVDQKYAESLVARFDKEVGVAKEFPGYTPGRALCWEKADRASAVMNNDEFIATNSRMAEVRPFAWSPGKKFTKSGESSTHAARSTAYAVKAPVAPALTVKSTDTAIPGLTQEQLARQREADAVRTKAQADARRNEAAAEAKRKKDKEERRKRGNKQ